MSSNRKIFYGWFIVGAGFACMWINAGVGFYAFPVFFVELTENFGWGRGATNAGLSISIIISGCASPLVGALLPKYGPKKVVIFGALIMSVAFLLFSVMQTLWQYYIICLILAIGWSSTGTMPTSFSVSDWFEKKRGMAMGIMLVGVGVGGRTFAPLTRHIIDRFDWQKAFLIYAVLISVVLLPVAGIIFKRRPAEEGVLPDGALPENGPEAPASEGEEQAGPEQDAFSWTLRLASRTRTFWVISFAYFMATFAQTAILLNQVTYFNDIGIPPDKAATALGYCALLGVLGKLFFGAMADRVPARFAMVLCFGLQAAGTVLLLLTGTLDTPIWFVLLWGFAMGGVITLEPLIVAECFGIKAFGVILGMIYVCTAAGGALGPAFAGFVSDITESYSLAFSAFVGIYLAAAVLSLFAVPPKQPQIQSS